MYSSQYPYFTVYSNQQYIVIRAEPNMYSKIYVIIDDQKVTTYYPDVDFYLPKSLIPSGAHFLYLIGDYTIGKNPCSAQACYIIDVEKKDEQRGKGEHDYRPGDILVASDNKKGIPDGYMGHAAIIVDGDYILESDYSKDSIAVNTIESFYKDHEWYALYRPVDEKIGQQAVDWGLSYHEKYKENVKKGINRPIFSFLPSKMKDLWNLIYCSKLVWVCYYYGANYKFEHERLWFSPQNLDEQLKKDKNFKLIYKHPDHSFKIKI